MAYYRKKGYRKTFRKTFKRKRMYRKPAVFTSNKGTSIQMVGTINIPVVNLFYGPIVFPTHCPGLFYDQRANPTATSAILSYAPFQAINNALSVYQNVYFSKVQVSVCPPSNSQFTYQFLRNNIPLTIDNDGQLSTL